MDDPAMMPGSSGMMPEGGMPEGGDLVIKITCKADGTYGIDTETGAEESMEGETSAESGQSAGSAKECLQIVLDLIKNKGQVAGAEEQAGYEAAMGEP